MITSVYDRLQGLTFGLEIEFTNASRNKVAYAIEAVVGGVCRYEGTHLNNWVITMPDGRNWQVESDASVSGSRTNAGGEVVSPILTLADIDMVQNVVRAIRKAGAKIDNTCGGHIHVGAKDMSAKQISNLVKIFYKQEELIYRACGVQGSRLERWTKRTKRGLVDVCERIKNPTMKDLANAFYEGYPTYERMIHYCKARYCALNLHNLWNGGKHTIEFRFFEGTLHAGEIRTNILLALSLILHAKEVNRASAKKQRIYNPESSKYDLRILLLRLGWVGDEFKNPRKHMMKRLAGSAAHKRRNTVAA